VFQPLTTSTAVGEVDSRGICRSSNAALQWVFGNTNRERAASTRGVEKTLQKAAHSCCRIRGELHPVVQFGWVNTSKHVRTRRFDRPRINNRATRAWKWRRRTWRTFKRLRKGWCRLAVISFVSCRFAQGTISHAQSIAIAIVRFPPRPEFSLAHPLRSNGIRQHRRSAPSSIASLM